MTRVALGMVLCALTTPEVQRGTMGHEQEATLTLFRKSCLRMYVDALAQTWQNSVKQSKGSPWSESAVPKLTATPAPGGDGAMHSSPVSRGLQGPPSCPHGRRERQCSVVSAAGQQAPAAFICHICLCQGTRRPRQPLLTALPLLWLAAATAKAPGAGVCGAAGRLLAWLPVPGPSSGAPTAFSTLLKDTEARASAVWPGRRARTAPKPGSVTHSSCALPGRCSSARPPDAVCLAGLWHLSISCSLSFLSFSAYAFLRRWGGR